MLCVAFSYRAWVARAMQSTLTLPALASGLPEVCGIRASPMGMSQIPYRVSGGTRHLTLAISV